VGLWVLGCGPVARYWRHRGYRVVLRCPPERAGRGSSGEEEPGAGLWSKTKCSIGSGMRVCSCGARCLSMTIKSRDAYHIATSPQVLTLADVVTDACWTLLCLALSQRQDWPADAMSGVQAALAGGESAAPADLLAGMYEVGY